MRIPKIVIGYAPDNTTLSVDFLEKMDTNFSLHMENFLLRIGKNVVYGKATQQLVYEMEARFNAEMARLINVGLLKLDYDGCWHMEHIEDISNLGIEEVYRKKLYGKC